MKEKSLYYFHKNLKIKKKPKNPLFVGFFRWVFLGGFFWVGFLMPTLIISYSLPVWRIRDVYPRYRIRLFSIPDPGSSSKNLSILTPKTAKKWFISSKKYDPDCSSRIPDPDADFLPSQIQDTGVKKAPNPGSRIRIRNTAHY